MYDNTSPQIQIKCIEWCARQGFLFWYICNEVVHYLDGDSHKKIKLNNVLDKSILKQ